MPEIERNRGEDEGRRRTQRFASFAQETTLHGIPNIHHSKSTRRKIFWTVVLLLSGIAVVYEIYKVIGDYKNRPILTLYDFKSPNELFLPQVTICSENTLINYTKIRELKIHPQIVEFAKSTLSMNDKFTLGALNRAYGVKYPNYFSVFSEPTKDKARARLTKVLNKFSTNTTSDPALNAIFISLEAELISLFSNDTADFSDETDYFALHFESFSKYYDNDGEFDSWKFFRDNAFELEQVQFCIIKFIDLCERFFGKWLFLITRACD
jgi:hypothetical protein